MENEKNIGTQAMSATLSKIKEKEREQDVAIQQAEAGAGVFDGTNIILEKDGIYQIKDDVVYPVMHPDLSTQPSILPQRFGVLPIREVLIANGRENEIPNNAVVISAWSFNEKQCIAPLCRKGRTTKKKVQVPHAMEFDFELPTTLEYFYEQPRELRFNFDTTLEDVANGLSIILSGYGDNYQLEVSAVDGVIKTGHSNLHAVFEITPTDNPRVYIIRMDSAGDRDLRNYLLDTFSFDDGESEEVEEEVEERFGGWSITNKKGIIPDFTLVRYIGEGGNYYESGAGDDEPYDDDEPSIIYYTASSKLSEVPDYNHEGMRTIAFNTTIKSHTFENGVGKIEFDGVLTTVGNSAFQGCADLTSITIPNGVTTIEASAFNLCINLWYIDIPSTVRIIGSHAFYNCNIYVLVCRAATMPFIGEQVFVQEDLVFVVRPKDALYSNEGWGVTVITPSIESVLVYNARNKLPEVTGGYYGSGLHTDAFNVGIYQHDFRNHKGILLFNNSLTTIGDFAFFNSHDLTDIIVLSSVEGIGEVAFSGCENLTNMTCKVTTPPLLGNAVFNGVNSIFNIYVPAVSVDAYKAASGWSSYASDILPIP